MYFTHSLLPMSTINLAPTAFDVLVESATEVTKSVPVVGNAHICADSLSTKCRAGLNFYCYPSPVAKVFFGASCLCEIMGPVSSGIALITSADGIPTTGCLGSFGTRG